MPIESLADIEKLHASFMKALSKQMKAAVAADPPDPKLLLAQKVETLKELQLRLRDTVAARDHAGRQLDKDIRAQERVIADLEREIKTDRGRRARAGRKKASSRARRRK